MKKVRLLQPGYEKFTGQFGRNTFTNGLSDEPLLPIHAHFIGSAMKAEYEDGSAINPAENYSLSAVNTPAEAEKIAAERIESVSLSQERVTTDATEKYTREQLEEIADKRGIKGVREVADLFDVKANSVAALIEGVLKAQEA